MESTPANAEDATSEMTMNEVAAVLVHLKRLLRVKNRLCSLLLQLPTETIIHILSFIMKAVDQPRVWQPIFSTCHHIHRIMCATAELWWKVDYEQTRVARLAFTRSNGSPQAIIVPLYPWHYWRNEKARKALDIWRGGQVLHGHRLHTLELCGDPSDITRFSWIFERPLPRLHHLKIHFFGPPADDWEESQLPIPTPVALELPMDLPLQTLDLTNATFPWSSNLFAGLRELRMDFRDCETFVDISADELLGIFDASPRLESLSLVRVRPIIPVRDGEPQYIPTRVAQLPNLASLKLDNFPESVGYTLIHMDLPAIDSLEIRSQVLPFEVSWSLRFFSLNRSLLSRLFPNPPVFGIEVTCEDELSSFVEVTIGAFKMQFDFDIDAEEAVRDAIATCVPQMVPPSVAVLKLDDLKLSEWEWKEFLRSHPEVHSIEWRNSSEGPSSKSLWDALSPTGTDGPPLCPKLESISLSGNTLALLDCLTNRKNAGFGLRHLKFGTLDDGLVEEFRRLVDDLRVVSTPRGRDMEEWQIICGMESGYEI